VARRWDKSWNKIVELKGKELQRRKGKQAKTEAAQVFFCSLSLEPFYSERVWVFGFADGRDEALVSEKMWCRLM
jgi:hypothetical protein